MAHPGARRRLKVQSVKNHCVFQHLSFGRSWERSSGPSFVGAWSSTGLVVGCRGPVMVARGRSLVVGAGRRSSGAGRRSSGAGCRSSGPVVGCRGPVVGGRSSVVGRAGRRLSGPGRRGPVLGRRGLVVGRLGLSSVDGAGRRSSGAGHRCVGPRCRAFGRACLCGPVAARAGPCWLVLVCEAQPNYSRRNNIIFPAIFVILGGSPKPRSRSIPFYMFFRKMPKVIQQICAKRGARIMMQHVR